MRIVTQEELSYFGDVTRRYDRATKPVALRFAGAREGQCHDNAKGFSLSHPDHPSVQGWLVAELGNAPGYFRLVAHSVNRAPDRTFVDVTPMSDTDRMAYRFIEHNGPGKWFEQLTSKFPEFYFPIIDALALSAS
jgi:hypothetical protein